MQDKHDTRELIINYLRSRGYLNLDYLRSYSFEKLKFSYSWYKIKDKSTHNYYEYIGDRHLFYISNLYLYILSCLRQNHRLLEINS